ncbi:GGDEF domain-containing protein [Alteromonas halophila]|nr:GGDEF domain-containing protein [Alteromonas halophila]
MESKQLQAFKQHNHLLSQFIIRLSRFYDGFEPRIDEELQTLRGHLAGTPNFTLATTSIGKLETLLQNSDAALKKYTKETAAELEDTVKALQMQLNSNDKLRKQATEQLMTLNQPVDNLFSLQSLLTRALRLYRQGLDYVSKRSPSHTEPAAPVDKKGTDKLYASIYQELNQLLSNYAQKKPDDPQLREIRELLDTQQSEDALLHSCVVIIRMIVQDAMSDASLTGKVIQSLHNSLGKIQHGVTDTIEQSRQQFDSRQTVNAELRRQLDDMEDAVTQSDTLEALRQQAHSYMQGLSSTLTEREEADRAGQQALLDLMGSMQHQLTRLQRQTNSYKKKLAEQIVSSQTDALTRLPNRSAYNNKVRQSIQAFQRGTPLAVAVADVDHFKSINDRFGHATGDKTLQLVARHLRQNLSDSHFVARWGGEEFIILLQGLTADGAVEALEKVRDKLASLPFKFKQEKVTITASFGITMLKSDDSADDAFNRADAMLYTAKRQGRNCVVLG